MENQNRNQIHSHQSVNLKCVTEKRFGDNNIDWLFNGINLSANIYPKHKFYGMALNGVK